MNKSRINLSKVLITIFLSSLLLAACNSTSSPLPSPSQPPVTTTIAQITETGTKESTATVSVSPALVSTPIPVLQPNDYLLSEDELPIELYKSQLFIFLKPDGSIIYDTIFFNAPVGRIDNSITVSAQPYLEVPKEVINSNDLITDPLLGKNSVAFNQGGSPTYVFYKGNALVSISGFVQDSEAAKRGELTLAELVNLGKGIESRLPDMLPFAPITFPDQLDQAAFDQYLKSLVLSKRTNDSPEPIPANTFSFFDTLCLSMEMVDLSQHGEFAIYDVQGKVYVQKTVPEFGYCSLLVGPSHAGQYEARLAINNTLVAILPFDIQ